MLITEIIDTKFKTSGPEKWTDGNEVPDARNRVGAGVTSFAVDGGDEQSQGEVKVKRILSPLTKKQLERDAKYTWFKAIQPLLKDGNPYVPRVYDVDITAYEKPGSKQEYFSPTYKVERLVNSMDIFSISAGSGGRRSLDYDSILSMAKIISPSLEKKMLQYDKVNIRDTGYRATKIQNWNMLVYMIRDYMIIENMFNDVDPQFMKVIDLIKSLTNTRQWNLDFHPGNCLIRLGVGGPRLVVYDPIV
jgi:hypothetical protein